MEEKSRITYGRRTSRSQMKMSRRKFIVIMFIGSVIALLTGIIIGKVTTFTSVSQKEPVVADESISKILMNEMKPSNIKDNLRILTEKVHDAGSYQEEEVLVDMIAGRWKDQLDEVKIYSYNVLLSFPNDTNPNYVAILDDNNVTSYKSEGFERAMIPSENFSTIHATYNAYAHEGHVEGDLVYVNYGKLADFDLLNTTLNIDVRGKICIARYGKVFRGDKAVNAERYGCLGLMIFTDPADYGSKEEEDDTFPKSWWMPHIGVQRGSLYMRDGDPLTPYFPAVDYTYRIPKDEAGLPRIPVQPVSTKDAYTCMTKIGGPVAPRDWQGNMTFTYTLGGKMKTEFKDKRFVLQVNNRRETKEVKNIIGFIRGAVEPERHVIIGNHRDAWVFGALDPSSGTSVMMEIARAVGKLVKGGKWRPRRSLMFCSWGAEEFGLLGSTEWTEQFEKKLLLEAVTYLNVDIAVQGFTTFRAKGTPNLRSALYAAAKAVPNPDPNEVKNNRPSVYDTWKLKYPDKDNTSRPAVKPLGSGSDYTFFLQKAGVSSVDIRYTYDEINLHLPSYPIYHSAHETVEYFEKFIDPEYKYSLAVAQVWAELTRRIADDAVIPFDCLDYAAEIASMISVLDSRYKKTLAEQNIHLGYLHESVDILRKSAKKLDDRIATVDRSDPLQLRKLNNKLMYLDRGFLDFNGLPGRQYFRHIVYAPSSLNSYSGAGFPGLVDAIEAAKTNGDWQLVKKQLTAVTFHLRSAASMLDPSF